MGKVILFLVTGRFLIDSERLFFYDVTAMKHLSLSLVLLAALCGLALPAAYADSSAKAAKTLKADKGKKDKSAKKAKAGQPAGEVGRYMSELKAENIWVGEKPATDADFYIYLTSASWCGPCNAEMPHVVEAYKKMRELGTVELVMLSGDREQAAAQGFAERYNAPFTVINPSSLNGQLPPGFTPPHGIPNAIFVDNEGNVIRNGHGALVMQWESLTVNNPDYATKGKAASTKKKAAADKKKKSKKK